jgi:Ca2+-binding RTX toxin-like protein
MRARTIVLASLGLLGVAAAPASATTITEQGGTLTVTASPGVADSVTLSGETPDRLSLYVAENATYPAGVCTREDPQYAVVCTVPATVVVDLGDGDDRLVVTHTAPAGMTVVGRGGEGDDELKAIDGRTRLTLEGGPGNDRLRSEEGDDVLRGGPGGDVLEGGAGADTLDGGADDDTLTGDACGTAAPDVLDGGPGRDVVADWGDCGPGSDRRPVTVTMDGGADDGRPGEGDDVRGIERLQLFVPANVVGGDGPEVVEVFAPGDGDPSSVAGRGGEDQLTGGNGRESLDGGAGDDRLEGGFGDDTITGGPGADEIHGDSTRAQCGGFGQSCTVPHGNDTIHARDGAVDRVTCGPGNDVVFADPADIVAGDCETVDRDTGAASGSPDAAQGGTAGPVGTAGRPSGTVRVVAPGRLRTALRRGLDVRLAGVRSGRIMLTAKVGKGVVAKRRVTIGSDGRARVRLQFTAKARRSLASRRQVKVVLRAGSASRTVVLRR